MAPPTGGGDSDMCRLARRVVAEAGDGAVVGGGGHQARHRHHVGVRHLWLPSLKETRCWHSALVNCRVFQTKAEG